MNDPTVLKNTIQAEAYRLGFCLFGVTRPDPPTHWETFTNWLAQGRHAGMDYLDRVYSRERRADPHLIAPDSRAVILLGLPYPNPNALPEPGGAGRIAAYAQGEDYHPIMEKRLTDLAGRIRELAGDQFFWRGSSDSGPVLERDLAQRAGLGWIGKNTCLIHPRHGSFFLLAEVFTSLDLEPDSAFPGDLCGNCRRCIEACPTGCILPDRTLDAGRCISYLTIENKGSIPRDLRPLIGEWVFGCDVCQMVCPWNLRFANLPPDPDLLVDPYLPFPDLTDALALDEGQFQARFRHSPLARAKRQGYLRNAAVVLGNRADPAAVPHLAYALINDPAALVRGHCAWALGRIGTRQARQALQQALSAEGDPQALVEIRAALDA